MVKDQSFKLPMLPCSPNLVSCPLGSVQTLTLHGQSSASSTLDRGNYIDKVSFQTSPFVALVCSCDILGCLLVQASQILGETEMNFSLIRNTFSL